MKDLAEGENGGRFVRWFTVLMLTCLTAVRSFASDVAPTEEDRLRAALRQATQQLESAQSDLAAAQASQAQAVQAKNDLQARYAELTKHAAGDHSAQARTIALLKQQVGGLVAEAGRLTNQLAQTQADLDKAAALAKANGAERDRLAAESAAQKKRITTLEAKNVALFLVGNQILDRYRDFGFGSALKVKEPFVGATRTRLENLVQDYQDKLLDARDHP